MSTEETQRVSIVPAAVGGCVLVAAAGLGATVVAPTAVGRLLVLSVTVAVLSALLPDRRAWLAVTATGALTFLLAIDDGENGWPYLVFLGLAAVLGRGQWWMRNAARPTMRSSTVDR